MNTQAVQRHARGLLIVVVLFLLSATASIAGTPPARAAQTTETPVPLTCSQLLPLITDKVKSCATIDRNQVCFGNSSITAELQDASVPFAKPGDTAPIKAVKSLKTGPLNLDRGEWGLAVLKAQANLPGTTAGQAVTFILYGETSLTDPGSLAGGDQSSAAACPAVTTRSTYLRSQPGPNAPTIVLLQSNAQVNLRGRQSDGRWFVAESGGNTGWLYIDNLKASCDMRALPVVDPSQPFVNPNLSAFYFSTGVSAQSTCKDLPPDGMMIQSPGGTKVSFRANGADITIGSTIILRNVPSAADPNVRVLKLWVAEGQAVIRPNLPAPGAPVTVNAGQEVELPLGGPNGQDITGPLSAPTVLTEDEVNLGALCQIAQAAGLSVPCTFATPTPTPIPTRRPPTARPVVRTPVPQQPTIPPTSGLVCTFNAQFGADNNPAVYDPKSQQACTTLRWNVSGVEGVLFNGQIVPPQGAQQVCIRQTTTFTLQMVCGGNSKSINYTLRYAPPTQPPTIPPTVAPTVPPKATTPSRLPTLRGFPTLRFFPTATPTQGPIIG